MAKRRSILVRQLRREQLRAERAAANGDEVVVAQDLPPRPKTRGECRDACRPCPWVGCRYNLFLDVTHTGSLKLPHGEEADDVLRMGESCALDIAERGGLEFAVIRHFFGLSEFGLRLIANKALAMLSRRRKLEELAPLGPQTLWREGVNQAYAYTRSGKSKANLREFFDSPLERRGDVP